MYCRIQDDSLFSCSYVAFSIIEWYQASVTENSVKGKFYAYPGFVGPHLKESSQSCSTRGAGVRVECPKITFSIAFSLAHLKP